MADCGGSCNCGEAREVLPIPPPRESDASREFIDGIVQNPFEAEENLDPDLQEGLSQNPLDVFGLDQS